MSSLSQNFVGVAMKRLVSGELPYDPTKGRKSTQHEFNVTKEMVELFGTERIENKTTTYIYLSDEQDESLAQSGSFSFYNSREGKPRSAEYRIYYSSKNPIIDKANEGDLLIVGRTLENKELFIIAETNSTAEQQLMWLFGLEVEGSDFQIKELSEEKRELGFVGKYILSAIGIDVDESRDGFLDEMIKIFNGDFPDKLTFSKFARTKVKNINAIEDPDETVLKWYEMEYELFKTLEKYLIRKKLEQGFGNNVEAFLSYSLSAHQRRKSRAGGAFENHLEEIFIQHKVKFTSQAKISQAKPDFIFPDKDCYYNEKFPVELLTMLGAKTTAKERWKQLIPETKITPKHFITLEPAISKNQTDDMINKGVQLIVPVSILSSYKPEQQKSIMKFRDFIDFVKEKQIRAGIS